MEITYQRANPYRGNESFLLRAREPHETRTPCVLVDAGNGVDVDALLGDDEYLAAILLTHAHVDHYGSLDEAHRDGTPIVTSPGTAAIIEDVLGEGARHYGLSRTETILDHVEGISGWLDVVSGAVRVHPVPAGHAPGACGFLVQFGDGPSVTALVTGDFTRRDAAGYPGFDPNRYVDIDAVFLTAATDDAFDDTLTETVATLVRRAFEGSTTLCTASGLTGVHLATLLAGVERELDQAVPVTLAGQVAKLYERLDYDYPNVEAITTYADPSTCLDPGTVTIAGPEVPDDGSSGRFFDAVQDDPNATIVQVLGGATEPKDGGDAAGTVSSTRFVNHPSEDVLDEVVETIEPTHVVVGHQSGHSLDRYKDKWDVYTWANRDDDEQTLFEDGSVVPPHWVGGRTHRRVHDRRRTIAASSGDLVEQLSLPDVDRRDRIDLEAEGIDLPRLRKQLRIDRAKPVAPAQPTSATGRDSSGGERTVVTDGGLYETVGCTFRDETDVRISVDANDPDEPEAEKSDDLFDTVSAPVPSAEVESTPTDEATESGDEEHDREGDVTEMMADRNESDESHETDDVVEERRTDEGDQTDEEEDHVIEFDEIDRDERIERTTDEDEQDAAQTAGEETTTIELDPVVRSLAADRADDRGVTVGTVVVDAVEGMLTSVLRGEDVALEPAAPALTVDADPALERVIERSMPEDGDVAAVLRRTICEGLGVDPDVRTVPVAGFDALEPLVDAVTDNDDFDVTDRDQLVQIALERRLLEL